MKLRVVSTLAALVGPLVEHLRKGGHEVEVVLESETRCELRYRADMSIDEVTALVDQLKPLLPSMATADDLGDFDASLHVGDSQPLSAWEVKVHADSEALGRRLQAAASSLGFRDDGRETTNVERNEVHFGGASAFARQAVRWILAGEGIRVTEKKAWGDGDDDIWIYAKDPAFEGRDLRECFPVEVEGDDYASMLTLKERLEKAGFQEVRVRLLDRDDQARFRLFPGPFARDPGTVGKLRFIVEALLGTHSVDRGRFPLEEDGEAKVGAVISLPLGAHAEGTLFPYRGAHPDRWDIVLRGESEDAVAPLRAVLTEAGYSRTRFERSPETSLGYRVRWGAAGHEPEVADFVQSAVQTFMEAIGAAPTFKLTRSKDLDDDDNQIVIDVVTEGLDDGSLLRRVLATSSKWELSFKAQRPSDMSALVNELRELQWAEFETESDSDIDEAVIKYGGAPAILIEHVADIVERHTGVRPYAKKEWDDDDDDIWVYLPPTAEAAEVSAASVNLDDWLRPTRGMAEVQALIEVDEGAVRVGRTRLNRRADADSELVPDPARFSHYCIDQRTAETLAHVARSVALREPCLLEGETSVSKTSIIQYLAMLLGQPVVRINLNGQTDTGELVGRFVPQSDSELPVTAEALLAAADLLEPESRSILEQAQRDGRALSPVEIQQVMANEQMTQHPWRWQDGLVISAMRHGWWVILDELNLAEPQILERLNSVLERQPTLVLTEYDNSLIGGAERPIHPEFRIFATMNPAEYAGRSPLSPAYRDRWRGYRFVAPPTERDYMAMLEFLVDGSEPDVTVLGTPYLGRTRPAPLAVLSDVPDLSGFLRALARFHAALEGAVGGGRGQLGARRRERYVFTRRGLLSVMDYLVDAITAGVDPVAGMRGALLRYYIGRVSNAADQAVVVRLLDAAGIGPDTWTLDPDGDD